MWYKLSFIIITFNCFNEKEFFLHRWSYKGASAAEMEQERKGSQIILYHDRRVIVILKRSRSTDARDSLA